MNVSDSRHCQIVNCNPSSTKPVMKKFHLESLKCSFLLSDKRKALRIVIERVLGCFGAIQDIAALSFGRPYCPMPLLFTGEWTRSLPQWNESRQYVCNTPHRISEMAIKLAAKTSHGGSVLNVKLELKYLLTPPTGVTHVTNVTQLLLVCLY